MTDPTEAIRNALEAAREAKDTFELHCAMADFHAATTAPSIRALLDRLDSAERALANMNTSYNEAMTSLGQAVDERDKLKADIGPLLETVTRLEASVVALLSVGEKEPK